MKNSISVLMSVYKNDKLEFLIFPLILSLFFIDFNNDTLSRYSMIITRLINLEEYSTFLIWYSFITFETNISQFLFGHGLGIISTASQQIYDYKILNGSTESFLLQIYFEMGIVGLFLFLFLFIKSIYNFLKSNDYRYIAYILLGLSISLLGTPAFYGFFTSFIFYSFIVFGYLLKHTRNNYV
jgi:hypothetical protein